MEQPAHAGHVMPANQGEIVHPAHDMSAHAGHSMPAVKTEGAHTAHDMGAHAGHVMPAPAVEAHAGHAMAEKAAGPGEGQMAAMAHEMGHGGGMSMEGMLRDMRNRFLVSFILAIPVFLYSPLFTDTFGIQLPLPFGLSNETLSFLLATPAVIYGGWVFYIGAWRGLKNRVLNMSVLVSLSVLAGYLFSVSYLSLRWRSFL
jgi:Cu2+-exporting ATPase